MGYADSINIENVIASSGIDQELDLQTLSGDLGATNYNTDRFPGLVYRMQDPKATALIFRSGKIVCTGAKSIDGVRSTVEQVFDEFRELGLDVPTSPKITVQNIVSSADLDHRLNLNAIAIGFGLEHIEYEPEQFPGLVYRLDNPDVVALLFGSGKLVITGSNESGQAEQALEKIEAELNELGLLE